MSFNEEKIEEIVRKFYLLAINDIFLSYQFKKINKNPNKYKILESDLGDFESHLPKVIDFWCVQLIPEYKSKVHRENVLKVHSYLNIHQGELGRWVLLFKKCLSDNLKDQDEVSLWSQKVDLFQAKFENYFFNHNS